MIRSMTGFSSREHSRGDVSVAVEIRSVNSRYLDVAVRLPGRYAGLEERVKAVVAARLARGRVDVHLTIRETGSPDAVFEVDDPRARAYIKALEQLSDLLADDTPVTLQQVLSLTGVIRQVDTPADLEICWPVLQDCLETALEELVAMRQREGHTIAADFQARLEAIEEEMSAVSRLSEGLIDTYRDRLHERLTRLTRGMSELDPGRLAQEAAILADRSDISEEVLRVHSHLDQFRQLMGADEPAGRKLNFLIQELNREINTIGSKIGNSEAAHRVVNIKAELEKLREQVQNIE